MARTRWYVLLLSNIIIIICLAVHFKQISKLVNPCKDQSHQRLCDEFTMDVFEFEHFVTALKHMGGFIQAVDDNDKRTAELLGKILGYATATRRYAFNVRNLITNLKKHVAMRYCIKKTTTTQRPPFNSTLWTVTATSSLRMSWVSTSPTQTSLP